MCFHGGNLPDPVKNLRKSHDSAEDEDDEDEEDDFIASLLDNRAMEEDDEEEELSEEEQLEKFIETIQPERDPNKIISRKKQLTDEEKQLFTYFVAVPRGFYSHSNISVPRIQV